MIRFCGIEGDISLELCRCEARLRPFPHTTRNSDATINGGGQYKTFIVVGMIPEEFHTTRSDAASLWIISEAIHKRLPRRLNQLIPGSWLIHHARMVTQ
jgi:hypothetical protein